MLYKKRIIKEIDARHANGRYSNFHKLYKQTYTGLISNVDAEKRTQLLIEYFVTRPREEKAKAKARARAKKSGKVKERKKSRRKRYG